MAPSAIVIDLCNDEKDDEENDEESDDYGTYNTITPKSYESSPLDTKKTPAKKPPPPVQELSLIHI